MLAFDTPVAQHASAIDTPSHHVPAVPVHDVHQVDEALGHGQAQVIAAVHTSMGVPARCSPCPMLHTPAGCAGLTG